MLRRLAIVPALLVALTAAPSAQAWVPPIGCATGSPAAAASQLVHPGAEINEVGQVAGFRSALALEPLVYPGVRHRLIQAGSYWCDATGFNSAWRISGRAAEAVQMASAYSRIAAAPYFDGVTVRSSRELRPGVVSLDTHALTNGITARWLVTIDSHGISRASWTSTALAVKPFEAEWEGVSASPGVHRSYERSTDGTLRALQAIVPEVSAVPETVTEGKTVDDFTIRLQNFNTPLSPNLGQDTGVDAADRQRLILKMLIDNYNEFHGWGLRKGWTSEVGLVHIDSSTSATCWACVFIREDFNIHITTAVTQILFALGWEYPDDKDALSNVLGHEMVHNFQNAYYKPTQNGASTSTSFSEGTARFQESLHAYSEISHQPNSLIYSTGRAVPGVSLAANSCNGWDGANIENDFAAGPFTNKSYNACYFWLSWYLQHGTSGIVDLFAAMRNHATKSGHQEVIDGLQEGTGGTFGDDLAAFAQAAITGRGYSWAAPGATEPVRDWGLYLDRWTPQVLQGTQWARTIGNGGVTAREITTGGHASLSSTNAASLYVIRDDGTASSRTLIDTTDAEADLVEPPASGERVWLVAVYPSLGNTSVTVGLTP
jgi:hypothetical protein